MAIRVLIINQQLVFAVTLKQALEQTGRFDVHPFTTADAAFDFLRDHPQDVALVDFTLPGSSGAKIVQQLRGIQPDLAIIISPQQPDAEAFMDGLGLQGMIDMPFGARDVMPLIEQAVEQMQSRPPESEAPPPDDQNPAVGQTQILGETDPYSDRKRGTTRLFDGVPSGEGGLDSPAQTRNLDDVFSDLDLGSAPDHEAASPDGDFYDEADDPAWAADEMSDDAGPAIKPLRRQVAQTQDFDTPVPEPPEISSLENVLKSFGFDPPPGEEDTPAVPLNNSEALRQFLATTSNSGDAEQFDGVLDAIDPNDVEQPRRETDFDALVRSMKGGDPRGGLPERQQQLLDFVLTSGMDSVLREIEKSKTERFSDKIAPPETMPEEIPETGSKGSFQKLAKEEPPMPSLEEGGTVSDLMLGVSDRGFRTVLSLLRGDEPEEAEISSFDYGAHLDRHDRFADFFSPITGQQALPEAEDPAQIRSAPPPRDSEEQPAAFNFDDIPEADEEASVAQVILKAALEELDLPEGFSLNQLLTDIENRLSLHKLNVRPLPSWQMDTSAFRPVTEEEIREPDFLPEELPPGELVGENEALEFEEPESFTGHTTRPSLSNQQALAAFPVEEDTLFDAEFIKETLAPQVTPVDEPSAVPDSEPDALPDWPEEEEPVAQVDSVEETADEVLPDWLPEVPVEAEAETEAFPMDRLEEDTTPSLVFTADETAPEAETVLSGDTWDIRITPDEDEEEEQPDWSEAVEADEASADDAEQRAFEAALDNWSLESDLQETADQWDLPPDEAEAVVQETSPAAEEVSSEPEAVADESWDLLPSDEEGEAEPEAIPEDPYIAQLALNLTQFSLESSAEGTLLTRGDEVVAYAGHLSNEDASELRDAVNNDWDANPEGARIRFITLPSSGKDYMLYSIRTEIGFTLSMIFAGTTPLRVIRQQGQKLIAALESIPETAVEEMAPEAVAEAAETPDAAALVPYETAVDESVLNAYTYVWLLRDPEGSLSDAVAQAIMAGLKIQLRELGWSIRELQVHEDFVYLYAGVPGDTPPHETIRELKRCSAEIAHAQNPDITPQMLWADAYLILTPGRELATEEILEFVNFQRMA